MIIDIYNMIYLPLKNITKHKLFLYCSFFFAACKSDNKPVQTAIVLPKSETQNVTNTTVHFNSSKIVVQKKMDNETVDSYFVFQNTGQHPFNIKRLNPDCYCTQLDYPRAAVMPQQFDTIKFSYEIRTLQSAAPEWQKRNIKIDGNIDQPITLELLVYVYPAKK